MQTQLSERSFVLLVSFLLAFLSLTLSSLAVHQALRHGIVSFERVLAIGVITASLPIYIVARRYGRLSSARSAGASIGGVLLFLAQLYMGDALCLVLLIGGFWLVVRNVAAGPEPI